MYKLNHNSIIYIKEYLGRQTADIKQWLSI
jgi:hypothetical protein